MFSFVSFVGFVLDVSADLIVYRRGRSENAWHRSCCLLQMHSNQGLLPASSGDSTVPEVRAGGQQQGRCRFPSPFSNRPFFQHFGTGADISFVSFVGFVVDRPGRTVDRLVAACGRGQDQAGRQRRRSGVTECRPSAEHGRGHGAPPGEARTQLLVIGRLTARPGLPGKDLAWPLPLISWPLSFGLYSPSFGLCALTFVLRPSSFVLLPLAFVLRPSSFVLWPLSLSLIRNSRIKAWRPAWAARSPGGGVPP